MLKFRKNKLKTAIILINIIAVLLCVCEVFAQEQNKLPETEFYIADSLMLNGDYNLAADYYKRAMKDYLPGDIKEWYILFGKFRKARAKAKSVPKLLEELNEFTELLDQDQNLLKGKVLFYIGYYNSRIGFTSEAILGYKEAIKEFSKINDNKSNAHKFLLFTYDNLALRYSKIGDQKSAIKYIELGIDIISKLEDKSKMCDLFLNYSEFLYYDNKFKDVKNKLTLALNECKLKNEKGLIYNYFAQVYIKQDSLELAKAYLEKSLKINNNKEYFFYVINGAYYEKKNDLNEAENQYKLALSKLQGTISQRSYIKTLMFYSKLLYNNNKKEEALINAHLAMRQYYPDLDSLDLTDRSKINEVLPDIWIIEALNIKARYFREKYIETKNEFSLTEAIYYYDLLLSHFDKLKSKYYSSSSKHRMGAYSQEIYSSVISFYIDQYIQNGKISHFENAFRLAQRANSFVLRNAVSDRKALEIAGVNQDSLEQYLFLLSKVSSDIKEDIASNGVNALLEFDAYKESLLTNYPSYGKYDKEEEISIAEIQSTLDKNSLVVKYYYFNEILTVFGISKHSTFAENISFAQDLDSLISSNLQILSQSESNDSLSSLYLSNSKIIYDLVLGDLVEKYDLQHIDHLTIVPDGPLKKVSFNALSINSSKDWYAPSTYLMSKFSVNYLYYCSQLKNENQSYSTKDGFIGFGIEYEDDFLNEIVNDYMSSFKDNVGNTRSVSLSPLKYADEEAITTAKILNGISIVNSDVTPTQVLSEINKFDVVHFSAHAFVNEDDYLNSFVVLNRDDGEEYQLKYSDILNLDIDSELVVLSACQTSSGKSVVGEGLMSLSRAFVQSGSKAAVGSYWNAPDYATKELMTLFYTNLKEGLPKSKALQKAQIEYLQNDNISSPTIRSPFYWASWAIYGNDEPLKMQSSFLDFSSWEIYLFLGVISLIVILLVKFYSSRSNG